MRPHFRALVLRVARSKSLRQLAQDAAAALATDGVVLARLWVADPSNELRLVGSAGAPAGGGSYSRLDGEFSRISAGRGKIAAIAESRQPRIVRGIRGDEEWLTNPSWVARQGVRAFLGYPLLADDAVLGVLAIFTRVSPTDADLEDLQLIADLIALRMRDLSQAAREPEEERVVARHPILTRAEMRAMERHTIEAALARTSGKVFGVDGAAALLGMRPTTLASRIKALGLR